jgi:hypothetical protein
MFGGASITNKESILFIADSADRCLVAYQKEKEKRSAGKEEGVKKGSANEF